MKAPWSVELTQLDDGSIFAKVGCKTLSYRPRDPQLLADLTAYFNDPEGTIKRFSAGFGWAIETGAQPPDPYRPFVDGLRSTPTRDGGATVGATVEGGSEATSRC